MSDMMKMAAGIGAIGGSSAGASGASQKTELTVPTSTLTPIKHLDASQLSIPKSNIDTTPRVIQPTVRMDPEKMQSELNNAISLLNEQMTKLGRNLGFSVDHQIGMSIVTVNDQNTGAMIRQIPNEAVIRVAQNIESLKGVIYSKSV